LVYFRLDLEIRKFLNNSYLLLLGIILSLDKRVLALGVTMLAIGFSFYWYLNETEPAGTAGMTDEEKSKFEQDLVMNIGLRNIAAMVGGLGFFIALISIGIRGKKKGGVGKTVTQKPAET